jgi:glycosyltransferase involved in cell wall biosynthesis
MTEKVPTLCLNMIVKNESKIITRLLESVSSIIDCYCICDTGSTDNTIDIISDFFLKKDIPGKIIKEPFRNFCHNRNVALKACSDMSDYVLLLDADMIFEIRNFNKKMLVKDNYCIKQGNELFFYDNMRILKNNGLYKYVGVTHEYIDSPRGSNFGYFDKNILFINDIGDGGSKSDKYIRDIKLLENGLIDEPDNNRYHFYLANSYKDGGFPDKAIEFYKKILNLNSWNQEKYISCMKLYDLYNDKNEKDKAVFYLVKSHKYDNDRIEGIYKLVQYYCVEDMNDVAYAYYSLVQNYFENNFLNETFEGKLFVNVIDYNFYLPYYMIIVSWNVKKYETGIKMYRILFEKKATGVTQWWINNLFTNLQFFIDKVSDDSFMRNCEEYINFLFKNNYTIDIELLKKYENFGIKISNLNIK